MTYTDKIRQNVENLTWSAGAILKNGHTHATWIQVWQEFTRETS